MTHLVERFLFLTLFIFTKLEMGCSSVLTVDVIFFWGGG